MSAANAPTATPRSARSSPKASPRRRSRAKKNAGRSPASPKSKVCSGLPDMHAGVRRDEEFVARLDAVGVVPRVDVANHAVAAVFGRRVLDARHLHAQSFVALDLAPHLRPAEDDALLAAEAVEHRRRLA